MAAKVYTFFSKEEIIMFCSNCGKEIPEGVNRCPNCGKEQDSTVFSTVANYAGQK